MTSSSNQIIPYAFVRFSNEAITLKACLESIVPFCSKGVICYHDPLPGIDEDGSVAIAQEFVKKHPGFRLIKYPFPVIYHNSSAFYKYLFTKVNRFWLLDAFSTFTLLQLRDLAEQNGELEQAYLLKVDCDHVYNQQCLNYMLDYAQNHPEYNNFLSYQFNCSRDLRHPGTVWFHNFINTYDHIFCKLTEAAIFEFIYIQHPDYKPGSSLPYGGHERLIYANSIKHCEEQFFLNSIHFNREKYITYNHLSDEEIAQVYKPDGFNLDVINTSEMEEYFGELKTSLDFFKNPQVKDLMSSLNYSMLQPGKNYGRDAFDIEELINNPKYQPNNIIAQINETNHKLNTGELVYDEVELANFRALMRVLYIFYRDDFLPQVTYNQEYN